MTSNNSNKHQSADLLEDCGYTEELSHLTAVNNINKPVSKLQCPLLQFSDDETEEQATCIVNNKLDTYEIDCQNCEEPQHVMTSIIQKDVEFISREITGSNMNGEENVDTDSIELANGFSQIPQIEHSDEDIFCTCPIVCLPRELVLKIFAYISQEDLCCRLSCVCKLWHDLAFDPVLWKTIDLTYHKDIPSVNLCRLIARATNLRKLILHGRETISESEVTVFSDFLSHLQYLDLGFCQNFNSSMLSIIVSKCPMLEGINMEGDTSFKPGSLQILSRCKNMKDMNFSHTILDNEDLYWLVKHLDCIRCINIDGISWIEEGPVTYLAEQHFEHLQELSIDGAEISDECYKVIGNCRNLTSFESSFCELITDKSLAYLQNLHKLRNLRLRKGTDLTTSGLIGLFSSQAMSNLITLDLSECTGCEDSCVQQIAQGCGKNLRALSLCWCWHITDLGITSVVDHCRNVIKLDLTGIDKIFGECFGRVPTEMPHLRLLDLRQCNRIKDELIESVVRQKRDLVAINYYGEELEYGVA